VLFANLLALAAWTVAAVALWLAAPVPDGAASATPLIASAAAQLVAVSVVTVAHFTFATAALLLAVHARWWRATTATLIPQTALGVGLPTTPLLRWWNGSRLSYGSRSVVAVTRVYGVTALLASPPRAYAHPGNPCCRPPAWPYRESRPDRARCHPVIIGARAGLPATRGRRARPVRLKRCTASGVYRSHQILRTGRVVLDPLCAALEPRPKA
jgi:hypothetical protein